MLLKSLLSSPCRRSNSCAMSQVYRIVYCIEQMKSLYFENILTMGYV